MDKVYVFPPHNPFLPKTLWLADNGHTGSADRPYQLPVGARAAVFRQAWSAICRRDGRERLL